MMKSYAKLALGILALVALNGNVSTESQSRLNLGEVTATAIDSVVFIPQTILKIVVKIVGFVLNIIFDINMESICDKIENFSLGTTVVEFFECLFSDDDDDTPQPQNFVQDLIDLRAILKPDGLEASFFKNDGQFKSFIDHMFYSFPLDEVQQALLNEDGIGFTTELQNTNGIGVMLDRIKVIDWESFQASMENGDIQQLFTLLNTIDFKGVAEGKETTYDVTTFVDSFLADVDLEKSASFYASDGPLNDFFKIIIENETDLLGLENGDGSIDYTSSYDYFKGNTVLDQMSSAITGMYGIIARDTYFVYLLNSEYRKIMDEVFSDDFQAYLAAVV